MKDYKNIEINDLILIIQGLIANKKEKLKERKNNISSDYILAKIDFTCIDNMEDVIATLETRILPTLKTLQNRIIERNTK